MDCLSVFWSELEDRTALMEVIRDMQYLAFSVLPAPDSPEMTMA